MKSVAPFAPREVARADRRSSPGRLKRLRGAGVLWAGGRGWSVGRLRVGMPSSVRFQNATSSRSAGPASPCAATRRSPRTASAGRCQRLRAPARAAPSYSAATSRTMTPDDHPSDTRWCSTRAQHVARGRKGAPAHRARAAAAQVERRSSLLEQQVCNRVGIIEHETRRSVRASPLRGLRCVARPAGLTNAVRSVSCRRSNLGERARRGRGHRGGRRQSAQQRRCCRPRCWRVRAAVTNHRRCCADDSGTSPDRGSGTGSSTTTLSLPVRRSSINALL